MTSRARRLLFALLLTSLVAAGCSSSSDDATAVGSGTDASETADSGATDSESADSESAGSDGDAAANADDPAADATSIPVPDDDGAADDAIAGLDGNEAPEVLDADPSATVLLVVRELFNIDPEPEWISCIVAEAAQDTVLDSTLRTPSVASGQVDDTQLRALTFAMNGCVATLSLADWATQAIGPQGDVQQTAPPCLAERFDDAITGDTTFYNFVALTYQFRLEPEGVDELIDSLATCAPITSLSDFFAGQTEQSTNFATIVDRDCLLDVLSPPEVSQEFWDLFVGGGAPSSDVIDPYIAECSAAAEDDPAQSVPDNLAQSVPGDFVPWSGTGALAGVTPAVRNGVYAAAPPMVIDPAARYEAVIATGGGEIRIELFADSAPLTVNNFVQLARDGFYDNTIFHRVLADFMAQAGDPSGTGTGGPGYQFADEFEGGGELNRKGLLAMANSGPNTNGSQFFITFVPTDWLTGNHTLFGEVTQGIEILEAIQLRDPSNPNAPAQLVESITIIEGP